MNSTSLYYFICVYEKHSIAQASRICYISPQGISKIIKKMEKDLGVLLFVREAQAMIPTEYADILYRHALRIVDEYRQLNKEIFEHKEGKNSGIGLAVTMGTDQVMGREFMDKLNDFLALYGFSSVDSMDLLCEQEVEKGTCELAITAGPSDPKRFNILLLMKGYLCAFVHQTHPFYQRDTLSFKDLKNQKLITTNANFKTYHQLQAACQSNGFEANIIATTITIRKTCQLPIYRDAIGISSQLVMRGVFYDDFKVIPILDDKYVWELVVISKKDSELSKTSKRILSAIRQLCHEHHKE